MGFTVDGGRMNNQMSERLTPKAKTDNITKSSSPLRKEVSAVSFAVRVRCTNLWWLSSFLCIHYLQPGATDQFAHGALVYPP